MYNEIKDLALSLGAKQCQNCGELDITLGLVLDDNNENPICILCESPVQQFKLSTKSLYALEVFKKFAIEKNEMPIKSQLNLQSRVDEMINLLKSENDILSTRKFLSKFKEFQNLLKEQSDISFGGLKLGGLISIKKGEPSITVNENIDYNEMLAFGTVSITINFLLA
jgi:uncharacterized HAD superfamily protein